MKELKELTCNAFVAKLKERPLSDEVNTFLSEAIKPLDKGRKLISCILVINPEFASQTGGAPTFERIGIKDSRLGLNKRTFQLELSDLARPYQISEMMAFQYISGAITRDEMILALADEIAKRLSGSEDLRVDYFDLVEPMDLTIDELNEKYPQWVDFLSKETSGFRRKDGGETWVTYTPSTHLHLPQVKLLIANADSLGIEVSDIFEPGTLDEVDEVHLAELGLSKESVRNRIHKVALERIAREESNMDLFDDDVWNTELFKAIAKVDWYSSRLDLDKVQSINISLLGATTSGPSSFNAVGRIGKSNPGLVNIHVFDDQLESLTPTLQFTKDGVVFDSSKLTPKTLMEPVNYPITVHVDPGKVDSTRQAIEDYVNAAAAFGKILNLKVGGETVKVAHDKFLENLTIVESDRAVKIPTVELKP